MASRLSRDSAVLMFGEGGARLLAFIASFYLARELGPEAFGLITIGRTVLTYALWPTDLGMAQIGLRETALSQVKRRLTLGSIYRLRLSIGLGSLAVTALFLLLFVENQRTQMVSLLFLGGVIPTILQSEWYFQGKRRYGSIAVIRYLFGGIFLVGVLLLVSDASDLMHVPLVYTTALAVAALAALFLYRGEDAPYRLGQGSERSSVRDVFNLSLPVGMGGVLVQGVQMVPPLILALVANETTVGYFGAAFRLVLAAMIVDRIFIALYFPRITAMHGEGAERFASGLRRTFRPVLIGAFLLALLLSLLAAPITDLIYGAEYQEAAGALALLSWFLFGSIMTSFFSYPLLAVGVERAYFRSSLISAIATVILIMVGAFTAGLLGVCGALAAGEILTALLMYREFRRAIPVKLLFAESE